MGPRTSLESNDSDSRRLGFRSVEVRLLGAGERISAERIADARPHQAHWNVTGLSSDRTVSAVAEIVGQGRIRISVRAFAHERRNATVRVVLRSGIDPADVWITRKIKLDLNNGYMGLWSGTVKDLGAKYSGADAELVVGPVKRP